MTSDVFLFLDLKRRIANRNPGSAFVLFELGSTRSPFEVGETGPTKIEFKYGVTMTFALNYDEAIHLDAEALAEGGIGAAYELLLPKLCQFVKNPARIQEVRDDSAPSYSVCCGETEFIIYDPNIDGKNGNSWGLATVALFSIVNQQLTNTNHRFYAINGGNDLFGIFLTPTETSAARDSLPDKTDWPYLPTDGEDSWYGQFH